MEHFGRRAPAEAFSGTRIDKIDNGIYKLLRNSVEIAALWEEETQQSIGVFVRSTLPWFVRLREIDLSMEFGFQSLEFREFRPIVQTDAFYRDVPEQLADHSFRQRSVPLR